MKHHLLIGLLVASLTGCTGMGGLDRNTSRAKMLTTAAVGSVNDAPWRWPSADWWEHYRDPELNSLMDRALSLSPDVRLARARLEQAAAIAEQAGAQRKPTMSADADAVRKRYAQAYDAAPPLAGNFGTTLTLSADVHYTFDFWGGSVLRCVRHWERRRREKPRSEPPG